MRNTTILLLAACAGAWAATSDLHPVGGLVVEPSQVDWMVEVKPDAFASDPPPAVDHSANMPPVGNQGSLGSCTSWAFAYYYKTYQEWLERGWSVHDQAHQFSPTFLYNMANGGGNAGSYNTDNMRLLLDFGCATFADCPNSSDPVPWPSETAFARAAAFRCEEAYYINCGTDPGVVAVKQHIADGDNAVIPINVWANFDNINNFDTCYCSVDRYGTNRGGHYITFVGYDDARQTNDGPGAFRFVNSWGTGWGHYGYGWMSYAAVKDAQITYLFVNFLSDRIGYTPRLVARARVTHDAREDVRIEAGIRSGGATLWSKEFLNRGLERQGAHPFPDHDIPLDLTDGAGFLDALDTNGVFIDCRDVLADGVTGELSSLSAVDACWGAFGLSGTTGVPIPDDSTAAEAGLALPGQRLHWPGFHRFPAHGGASELHAELDTLRSMCDVATGGPVSAGPVMGDIDSDGRNEVVFGSDDDSVRAINGEDGSLAWSADMGAAVRATPAIGDLDADGHLDVVAGATGGTGQATVQAWDGGTGSLLWSHSVGAAVSGGLTIGDPNIDGRLEVILGAADGTVAVLDGETGGEVWSVVLTGSVAGAPALADINSDGRQEVIVGVSDSCYRVLDAGSGEPIAVGGLAVAVASAPTVADLNADGRDELIVGVTDGQVLAFAGDSDSLLWSFATGGPVSASPAVGDINADGQPEVVLGSQDSTVYALSAGGVPCWAASVGGSVGSAPALGFVNAYSGLDVIVGADDGNVYVLDGSSGERIVVRPTWAAVRSAPALGDVDGDGRLDVAVGSDDGRLYVFGGAPAGVSDGRSSGPKGSADVKLDIAPNLAHGDIVARVSGPDGAGAILRLYDSSGRLARTLWSGTLTSGDMRLDLPLAGLTPGTYFCRLRDDAGSTVTRRLVLAR